MRVIFPKDTGQHYYSTHYKYVFNIFKYTNCEIEIKEMPVMGETAFLCVINDKEVVFNFADNGIPVGLKKMPVFMFHYKESECKDRDNYFPFAPVSFFDWKAYYDLSIIESMYNACSFFIPPVGAEIINRQRPYGNALQRRQNVKNILSKYPNCKFNIIEQKDFFMEACNYIISVCVPGQNNNMLDRGQLQWMAFGGITISPELPEILPWMGKEMNLYQPFQTYIQCHGDYSDLINLIDYYMQIDNETLQMISNNAKSMFIQHCTPSKLIEWIKVCLKK